MTLKEFDESERISLVSNYKYLRQRKFDGQLRPYKYNKEV